MCLTILTLILCLLFFQFDRKTLSIALRFLKAKTPEQRAAVDLDTHYSEEYLEECIGLKTRRAILYQVSNSKNYVFPLTKS